MFRFCNGLPQMSGSATIYNGAATHFLKPSTSDQIMLRHLAVFMFAAVCNLSSAQAETKQLSYSGALSQRTRGGESVILRRFEVTALVSNGETFFAVLDDPDDGCPWPESYGICGRTTAHLTYRFDGNRYNILLPDLHVELPENASPGAAWSQEDWRYEIVEPQENSDPSSRTIQVTGRRGRKRRLTVDKASGLLQTARQDVFMGQGERFDLTLTQKQSTELSAEIATKLQSVQTELLDLQRSLSRRADTQQENLSVRQIQEASQRLDLLTKDAAKTPLEATVQRIVRDVRRQEKRVAEMGQRREELIGSQLPDFSLRLVSGGTVSTESIRGKTVILHCWDYSEKSLSEPYGQVAYLDFVYNKFNAKGDVDVIGVATAPGLSNPESASNRSTQCSQADGIHERQLSRRLRRWFASEESRRPS